MYTLVFRTQPSSSELTLQPSAEARAVALKYQKPGPSSAAKVKLPARVCEEARARLSLRGGDPNPQEVLAESELQLGQYRGQTFRWLLGNDVGYAVAVIASHERERESDPSQTPLMVHKDALTSYARLFPAMVAAIARRRVAEGSKPGGGLDGMLVGFGTHSQVSFKSLYEAKEKESRTYVLPRACVCVCVCVCVRHCNVI